MTGAFVERLQAGAIQVDPENAERWKEAIAKHAEDLADEAITDLVRAAFQRDQRTDAASILRSICLDADGEPAVPLEADFLTALLACEAVIEVLGRRASQTRILAAFLVSAARANGWAAAHPDVCTEGDLVISEVAIQSFTPSKPPRPAGQAAATKEALEALVTADWAIYQRAIVELSNEIARLRTHSTRLATYVQAAEKPVLEQQELSWWVIARRCISVDLPFSDLPNPAAGCLAALDLSRLAPRSPGPFAAPFLMAHVLTSPDRDPDDDLELLSAAAEQLRELNASKLFPVPPEGIKDFLPILSAIQANDETPIDEKMPLAALAKRAHVEIRLSNHGD